MVVRCTSKLTAVSYLKSLSSYEDKNLFLGRYFQQDIAQVHKLKIIEEMFEELLDVKKN